MISGSLNANLHVRILSIDCRIKNTHLLNHSANKRTKTANNVESMVNVILQDR